MSELTKGQEALMNKLAEERLQEVIFPELEQGRPNWDKPHTAAVVHYIKEIITANPQLNLDPEVLTIAAYAHDWGYAGLFDHGQYVSRDSIENQKAAHMKVGAEKITELLNDPVFSYLTVDQKTRITHLVAIHDSLDDLTDIDELILMEADSLGAIDPEATKPTLNAEDNQKFVEKSKSTRISRFVTDYSKQKVIELLSRRDEYYRNLASSASSGDAEVTIP